MQVDRIAGVVRVAGSVRGLGVCDVLRVELAPVQRAALEAQLGRGPPRSSSDAQRSRPVRPTTASSRACATSYGSSPGFARRCRRLRRSRSLHRSGGTRARARRRVPGRGGHVRRRPAGRGSTGAPWAAACERELEAAAAWITTALDCRAVEEFCFEPGVDPRNAW